MPWETLQLDSGDEIPTIGFGTWTTGNGEQATDQVEQAISVGFDHVDTAQSYRNESEAGQGLRESGIPRSEIFITTKFSGLKDPETSIQDSLRNLGVKNVDLYLIHHSRLANGDIPGLWRTFEKIHAQGLAKNIGVSNYNVADLTILLKEAKVKPAVNQILLHPYVYAEQLPIIEFCNKHGIVIEAYSPLIPITKQPGGPLEKPLAQIAERTAATHDQILLAWNKAKGSVVLTTSSKKSRLEGYLKAGDLELTMEEIRDIDFAGAVGPVCMWKVVAGRIAMVAAAAGVFWGASHVLASRCM
ncbi:Aldo/keto reductase [Ramaria rubella]|nr:Aldo/keto reductase [Ramaria rubella]